MISWLMHADIGFFDEVALLLGSLTVASEDLDIFWLGDEVRLVRNDDAHEPVAISERGERTCAGIIMAPFCEMVEEFWAG